MVSAEAAQGLPGAVADACLGYLDGPIRRIAAPDTPVPFAPVMENFYVPSVEKIVSVAKQLVPAG